MSCTGGIFYIHLQANIKQTNRMDKFEYVRFVAYKYLIPSEIADTIEAELWAEQVCLMTRSDKPELAKKYESQKEEYYKNEEIQTTLTALGLNKEKILHLLIFCGELLDDSFKIASWKIERSWQETSQEALTMSNEQLSYVTLEYGTHAISIPATKVIKEEIYHLLQNIIDKNDTNIIVRKVKERVAPHEYITAKLRAFTNIMKEVLSHFCDKHIPSHKTLIGRLAYIMKFTYDRRLMCGFKLVEYDKNRPYHKKLEKISNERGDFVKEEINIGKILDDTIKKCNIEPNFICSPLYYDANCLGDLTIEES